MLLSTGICLRKIGQCVVQVSIRWQGRQPTVGDDNERRVTAQSEAKPSQGSGFLSVHACTLSCGQLLPTCSFRPKYTCAVLSRGWLGFLPDSSNSRLLCSVFADSVSSILSLASQINFLADEYFGQSKRANISTLLEMEIFKWWF